MFNLGAIVWKCDCFHTFINLFHAAREFLNLVFANTYKDEEQSNIIDGILWTVEVCSAASTTRWGCTLMSLLWGWLAVWLAGWLAVSSGKLHADWLEVFEVNTRKTSCRTERNRDGNTTAAHPKEQATRSQKCCVSHSYASVSVISTPKLNNNMIKTRKTWSLQNSEGAGSCRWATWKQTNAQEAALLISRCLFFLCVMTSVFIASVS